MEWEPNEPIAFELTECSLPVPRLNHSYRIFPVGEQTRVSRVMEYQMKMRLPGRIMDMLIMRRKWDDEIKKFFSGLKNYAETH